MKRIVGRMLLRLPKWMLVRLSGGKRIHAGGRTLNPETQLILYLNRDRTPANRVPIDVARRNLEKAAVLLCGPKIPVEMVEDGEMAFVPVRVYTPSSSQEPGPALVFMHGGGWALGSLDSHDELCRFLARETGAKVISVDYRRPPEHPFPMPLEDAFRVYLHVRQHALSLNVDPKRIGVCGDSAGGNLAAAICVMAWERGEVAPCCQGLIYPALDMRAWARSFETYATGYFLTSEVMRFYIDTYLTAPEDKDNPLASPILAPKPERLPPAVIMTAGFDPLVDEAAGYAEMLKKAGVKVWHKEHAGLTHGFANMLGSLKEAHQATKEMAQQLEAFLNRSESHLV